jgi:hypothetical protein
MPKKIPIPELNTTPSTATQVCTEAGNEVNVRNAVAHKKPPVIPIIPPIMH